VKTWTTPPPAGKPLRGDERLEFGGVAIDVEKVFHRVLGGRGGNTRPDKA